MYRLFVVLLVTFILFTGCSRCSKEEAGQENINQNPASQTNAVQVQSDTGISGNTADTDTGTQMMHPNVRFVQTPDGKMVPEAAFKLKLPKMLNSQFLKNVAKEQNGEEKNGNKDSKKEDKE